MRGARAGSTRPTLEQIAERADVSIATASRVLSNKGNVAESKRRMVMTALADLAGGKGRHAHLLGLVIPDLHNPFFAAIAQQFALDAAAQGFTLLIAASHGRADHELDAVQCLADIGVKGLVFIAGGASDPEILVDLVSSFSALPTVAFDREFANLDAVRVDSTEATYGALSHLLELGHKEIGYVRGPIATSTAAERLAAFRLAAFEVGAIGLKLPIRAHLQFSADYTIEAGEAVGRQLLGMDPALRPSALLCANDLIALGILRVLQRHKWLIPEQLSIIGFDDVPQATWVTPSLASIRQPTRRLVQTTLRVLQRRLDTSASAHNNEPADLVLQCKYIPRESVAQPGRVEDNASNHDPKEL